MTVNMTIEESEPFRAWIEGIGRDGENVTINVADKIGDYTKEEAERQLKRIQRKGKLPKNRKVHMYQDVKKVISKKYGYVSIGGGKITGTLWHIVNDGSYRTKATHFIQAILNSVDKEIDRIWEQEGKVLEE